MMDKRFQRIGIGTKIINEVLYVLKKEGVRYARLGYVKSNLQARNFWIKNNFISTGIESETDSYTVVVMQREL